RGGLRKGLWNTSPLKIEYIKQHTIEIENTNPKSMKRFPTIKGGICAQCEEKFPLKELQVDHKEGNHSLKSLEDLMDFFKSIVLVTFEDLQFMWKECHTTKTYAEKQGVTFKQAKAEKTAILLVKKKKDKQWLEERGIAPA